MRNRYLHFLQVDRCLTDPIQVYLIPHGEVLSGSLTIVEYRHVGLQPHHVDDTVAIGCIQLQFG